MNTWLIIFQLFLKIAELNYWATNIINLLSYLAMFSLRLYLTQAGGLHFDVRTGALCSSVGHARLLIAAIWL